MPLRDTARRHARVRKAKTPARIMRLSGGRVAKSYFALGLKAPGYILDLRVPLPVPSEPATPNIPGGVMLLMHPPVRC
jgi:hypothetical protein